MQQPTEQKRRPVVSNDQLRPRRGPNAQNTLPEHAKNEIHSSIRRLAARLLTQQPACVPQRPAVQVENEPVAKHQHDRRGGQLQDRRPAPELNQVQHEPLGHRGQTVHANGGQGDPSGLVAIPQLFGHLEPIALDCAELGRRHQCKTTKACGSVESE